MALDDWTCIFHLPAETKEQKARRRSKERLTLMGLFCLAGFLFLVVTSLAAIGLVSLIR